MIQKGFIYYDDQSVFFEAEMKLCMTGNKVFNTCDTVRIDKNKLKFKDRAYIYEKLILAAIHDEGYMPLDIHWEGYCASKKNT